MKLMNLFIFIVVVISGFRIYDLTHKPVIDQLDVEINSVVTSQSFLKNKKLKADVFNGEDYLDCKKVGHYDIEVGVSGRKYNCKLVVSDNENPIVEVTNLTVYKGSYIEPRMFIKSIVDSTNVDVRFYNPINTNKLGVFQVDIVVEDEGNNTTIKRAIMHVIEKTL